MKRISHVWASLNDASIYFGRTIVKRLALIVVGAAIVLAGYVTVVEIKPVQTLARLPKLQKVHASSCSDSTLYGTYLGYSWGSTHGTLDNSVSLWTFNGSGSVSGSYWGTSGGVANSGTFTDSYTVNSDCDGLITYEGVNIDHISIANSGTQVNMVGLASGANVETVLKIAGAGSCSDSTLNGSYSGYTWGSTSGSLNNSVSLWTFNGSGSLSGSYWGMSGGSPNSGTFSDNYSVGSNCAGSITSGSTTVDDITVSQDQTEAYVVDVVSGGNIVTVLKAQ